MPKSSSSPEADDETVVAVCCGCFPARRKRRSTLHANNNTNTNNNIDNDQHSEASSLFYFDAVESPLGQDEYPPVFTTFVPRPKPSVSFAEPASLLMTHDSNENNDYDNQHVINKRTNDPIANHQRRSKRFERIARRPTLEHTRLLTEPRVASTEQGFPGGLTPAELEECQKFLRGVKQLDPGVMDQVYSFRDIEEEPYTICRWLRATKFKADDILQRLADNQDMFARAQQHDFFPDPSAALGAPLPIFLSQYPFLAIGSARNGCPVNYFMAGNIQPEGILCLTTIERLEGYFWWSFMWHLKRQVRMAQAKDPDFVRVEGINVIDLKGLSSSALTSETMDVIKLSSKVADFFPETLHCMLILNAPSFFSFSWTLIKKFLDPRTASRIQVFSSAEKGLQALRTLVDPSQIPQDFGGSYISFQQAFAQQASDPAAVRQEVELVHVKKGKTVSSRPRWVVLKASERVVVSVFTRSVSTGRVAVFVDQRSIESIDVRGSDGPQGTAVAEIAGPGTVTLQVQDLPENNAPAGAAKGYFLLVGEVKTKSTPKTKTNGTTAR